MPIRSAQTYLSERFLETLKRCIRERRIGDGIDQLTTCGEIFPSFDPTAKNSAVFLGYLAQWCDIGFGSPQSVKRLLTKYDSKVQSTLRVSEYVHILMAEGMVAMSEETPDRAICKFETVLRICDEMSALEVSAIANYWKARCHRKKGDYASALIHTRRARELQSQSGRVNNEAAMRVLEGLVLLGSGELEEAGNTLRAAEAALLRTDDYVSLGNIQSTYGRIFEQQGRYGQAIEHYAKAIEQYQKRDLKHTNVARAILDMSFAQIQVARRIRQNIDAYVTSRQKDRAGAARATNGNRQLRDELENLRDEILKNLDSAALIYRQHPNARGLARVHLYRGYLHMDMGDLVISDEEARRSYAISEPKHDFILMASARNLQCMVENAKVEEEIGGCAKHALAAHDHARDAIELANKTEDTRLLAIVYTWYGLTLLNKYFNDHKQAREAMDRAAAYQVTGVRDHIWNDFQTLRRKLVESTTLDSKLLRWAHGEIGDKTFRQLAEDFADLVIPRTWEQEERKISRVATRLSISPAKVRRVLGRLGHLESGSREEDKSVSGLSNRTHKMAGKVQQIAVSHRRPRRNTRKHGKIKS